MKKLVHIGVNVSRQEAISLISEFVALNKEIKNAPVALTLRQNVRFERINKWFSTGFRPAALDDVLDIQDVRSPDFVTELTVSDSLASHLADCSACYFRPRRVKFLATVIASFPFSAGIRFGVTAGRWGGYVSASSNFNSCKGVYNCNSDYSLDSGHDFWPSGKSTSNRYNVNLGCVFRTNRWLDVYLGAGYGSRQIFWQDIDRNWANVKDLFVKGLSLETGLVFSWRKLVFSAGVSTIRFNSLSSELGVGVRF